MALQKPVELIVSYTEKKDIIINLKIKIMIKYVLDRVHEIVKILKLTWELYIFYRDTFIIHQQCAINGPYGVDTCSSRKRNNVVGHISLITAKTFSGWLGVCLGRVCFLAGT